MQNDPTLLFVNAGMNPFKPYFLGVETAPDQRVANTQKCLRVSGKHNDLEDVGIDTYHHTLFEMMGNWSFGDPARPEGGYFKKEAIDWAWELLTQVYKIDPDRLFVTYFEGDKTENLEADNEARNLWKKHVSEDRILPGNKKDNFWEMGDQGPCGPCSEIHVDIRPEAERKQIPGRDLVNHDHPQVVEIWNLVFIQYNRKADGNLENLPAKHVDTGMGFERLCMVLQGKTSNYETDVFTPIIKQLEKISGKIYTFGQTKTEQEKINIALRVVADHLRAVAFAIADGQLPSNTGAGYVIRRILRRAIRYGYSFLDQKEAFIFSLVETLATQMGHSFPEIEKQKGFIANVIREEENGFLKTLEQGLHLIGQLMQNQTNKQLSGAKAFELYDTYGFPKDLTELLLKEKGWTLDQAGFEAEMEKQKNRSRTADQTQAADWVQVNPGKDTVFVGYDTLKTESKILKYRKVTSKKGEVFYQILLDKSPFYPEGGGQVGDRGYLIFNNEKLEVIDTKKENNQHLHFINTLPAHPEWQLTAEVDVEKRKQTQCNHSATHLLHHALRDVLGTHVAQKGSLVDENKLRFDFSHFGKLSHEELQQIEEQVNKQISLHLALTEHRQMPFKQAIEEGAMALFGEKYGEVVRTVRFGNSFELCAGTHVQNTGEIWYFKIQSEGAVAAGIRRIEAVTGKAAKNYFLQQELQLNEIKIQLKNPQDALKAIIQLQEENLQLKKQVEAFAKDKAKNLAEELNTNLEEVNGVKFLARQIDLDASAVKDLAFGLGQKYENLFLLLATVQETKVMLTCFISKALVAERNYDAGKVVRELGKLIHGGGGGQPFFATAGGKNPGGIPKALERARDFIQS